MFLHDAARSGLSPESVQPPLSLIWSKEVFASGAPSDYEPSSPVVAGGVVYVGSTSSDLDAFNAVTGGQVWSDNTGFFILCTPVVASGIVYAADSAYNATTGNFMWTYSQNCSNSPASPSVSGGIFLTDEAYGGIAALNASTGTEEWSYDLIAGIYYSGPAVSDGIVYVGDAAGHLSALNATSGTSIWTDQIEIGNVGSPTIVGGIVYASVSLCETCSAMYAFNATSGNEIWQSPVLSGEGASYSEPGVAAGILVTGGSDDKVHAFNATTGVSLWNFTTGNDEADSSPAFSDGIVYMASTGGALYALNATTGALTWSYDVGADVESSPVIGDGVVFVHADDHMVYAFAPAVTLITAVSSGSGSVMPNCPSPTGCSEEVDQSVTVTANPSPGWQFSNWNVTGASCSGGPFSTPCTFTMPNNEATVSATFKVTPSFTISSVTLTSPTNHATVTDTYVALSGKVSTSNGPVTDAQVTLYFYPGTGVNSSSTCATQNVTASGTFSCFYPLSLGPGRYTWNATATATIDGTTITPKTSTLYTFTAIPSINSVILTSPANGTAVIDAYVTLSGKVTAAAPNLLTDVQVAISVLGVGGPGSCSIQNVTASGTFSCNYQIEATGTGKWTATATGEREGVNMTWVSNTATFAFAVNLLVQQMPLTTGWNLISIPLVPASNSIGTVLASQIAGGNFTVIWSYQGGKWLDATLSGGKLTGTLTTFQDGYGYWIYMTKADNLFIVGSDFAAPPAMPPSYQLTVGWNLVGFTPEPTVGSESTSTYLSSLAGNYGRVYLYDNTSGTWTENPTDLAPGQAIWVYVSAPATLRP